MAIVLSELKIDEYWSDDEVPLRPSVIQFEFLITGKIDVIQSEETLTQLGYENVGDLDSENMFNELSPTLKVIVPYSKAYDFLTEDLSSVDLKFCHFSISGEKGVEFIFPELSVADRLFVSEEIKYYFQQMEKTLFELAKVGDLSVNELNFNTPKLDLELAKTQKTFLIYNSETANEEVYLTTFLNHYTNKKGKLSYDNLFDFVVVYDFSDKRRREFREIYDRIHNSNFLTYHSNVDRLSYRLIRSLLSENKIQLNESPYHALEKMCSY